MKNFKISQSITNRQDASLSIFFKEVSKLPLIDAEKEVELARRIKEGDEKAANELVQANLRFVISVAKQYQNKGLPLVDLIQEGCCGICEAALKFDETKGFRFISYAVWWIRQAIVKALSDQCRTIRVPMNQIVCMNKLNKATERFEQENGRKPSVDELSEQTDIDSDKVALTLSSINKSVSLDTPFNDEDAGCLLDVIPNENSTNTDEFSSRNDLTKSIESVLSKLPFRERDVLRMSFGIGMSAMQNEEIANRFGIGCERVRQIQREALNRLKKNYGNILKELL